MKKILVLFSTLIIFLVVGIIGVNAEEFGTQFQRLTTDGKITVEIMNCEPKDTILNTYLNSFGTEDYNFYLDSCNEDYTKCLVTGVDFNASSEQHEITITYKEVYSDDFKKLAPEGKIVITETTLIQDKSPFINNVIDRFNNDNNLYYYAESCDSGYTKCLITGNDSDMNFEQHYVDVVYQEQYSDTFKILTTDGKLIIPVYNLDSKNMTVYDYLNTKQTDNYYFQLNNCNNDFSECDIALYYGTSVESHTIKLSYKETYSDNYKKLSSNGALLITESTLASYKMDLINRNLNKFNEKNNTSFYIDSCNEDYTSCIITYSNPETSFLEQHNIKINFKDEYSDAFKKITADGTIKITSTNLSNNKTLLISDYLFLSRDNNNSGNWFNLQQCNDDYSVCDIVYYENYVPVEQHSIKILYQEEYGDIFKKLTTTDSLVIKNSTVNELRNIIDSHVYTFNTDDYSFYVSECNEDSTICNVVLNEYNSTTYMTREVERHNLKITYKEEFSDIFKKVTDTNSLVVKSIKPTTMEEAEFFLSAYASTFDTDKYSFYIGSCNDDYSICDLSLSDYNKTLETHKVKVTYAELDKQVQSKVNELLAKLPKGKKFVVEDLELVNYIVNSGYGVKDNINIENAIIDYSSEVKEYLGNMNARLDARAGWGEPFNSGAFGGFLVLYNDTVYGLLEEGGAEKNHIIYVPDNTLDTTEAYIAAAQKRINDYLGNTKVKITYGGTLDEFEEEAYKDLADSSKRRNEYYLLSTGEAEFTFLIVKDSSKIKDEIVHSTNDIMTGVKITTNSSVVPLDTTIKVNEIKEDSIKYKELTEKLDVTDALVYDLKLYSYTKLEYISKLEDGTFSVSVPLTDELKGKKDLIAYYVKDNGEVEKYEVHPDEETGMGVFTTNHFSIYTIAEKGAVVNEEVPKTYDGITTYVILSLVSLTGIAGSAVILKKKKVS